MKFNKKSTRFRLCIAAFMAVLSAFFAQGCSHPSEITVTGIGDASGRGAFPGDASGDDLTLSGDESVFREESYTDQGGSASQEGPALLSGTDAQTSEPSQIAVYVCGAVRNPGVCSLPAGARVCDALEEAGGFSRDADSEWLNQAKLLSDGEMLIVYTLDETQQMKEQGIARGGTMPAGYGAGEGREDPAGPGAESSFDKGDARVNLNTASREQLMTLPGIGEAKADAIIRYRTETGLFASIEDVMNISGIKNSVFEKIRDRITV